jgi:glycosyltransferase involved in cell wall biosynthesis
MTKLIIQIPCFNEASTLPDALASLPREIPGIDRIEILIVDDGSRDGTSEVARAFGVDHIVRFPRNLGLAAAFRAGMAEALRQGADIIVNTDADNQYNADDIPRLIEPLLAGMADIVVGDRQVGTLQNFSPLKRKLQVFGSWVISRASELHTPDATSGFRAMTREAALRLSVLSSYSYTLETLIQAGASRMTVHSVPIRINPQTRPSRLMRSIPQYIRKSGAAILRSYTMYRPLRVFSMLGITLIVTGLIPAIRFLYLMSIGQRVGHVQSLILAAILTIVGFQVLMIGLVADLLSCNRKLLEEVVYRVRRLEMPQSDPQEEPELQRATHA